MLNKKERKYNKKGLIFISAFVILIAIIFGIIFIKNSYVDKINLKSKVENYVEGNYETLGLSETNDSVVLSTKQLYTKGIITKELYKDNKNSVIKITVTNNGDLNVEVYNKAADNTEPTIILNGATTINVEYGTDFTDPGYTAKDNIDGDITSSVDTKGKVDTNSLGKYIITYSVSDSANNNFSIKRTIKVVDTKSPVITLNGNSVIYLQKGKEYIELGATAKDNVDGDISSNIVTNGTIDINKLGTYTVTYYIKDSSNNSIKEYRSVVVVENVAPIITLKGDLVSNIIVGSNYTDKGVSKVTDNYDKDLINKVITTGKVDTSKIGTYKIIYKVTNSNGVSSTITRTVHVIREAGRINKFSLSGATSNIVIPGIFEGEYKRNFIISNFKNQYNEDMSVSSSDITWNVTEANGVSIQDNGNKTATLNISNTASVQEITISATIKGVTKSIKLNLTKVPTLSSFNISGDSSINVLGNANTTSQYSVIDALDQYGNEIEISNGDITWSLIDNDDSNISISNNGIITMNKNVDLSKTITVKATNENGTYNSYVVDLNKINITNVDILDSTLTSVKNSTISLRINNTKQLSGTFSPSNATINTGTWASADATKVTVVNGLITVIGGSNGNNVIISYTVDNVTANLTVTIQADTPESAFTFDSATGTITGYDKVIGGPNLVIPSQIGGVNVTTIGTNAFMSKSLTSIVVPNTVTTLLSGAFRNNSLTSVTLPNTITSMGTYTFAYNSTLQSITIPVGISAIPDYAFMNNGLTSITIPSNITSIGMYGFYGNQLTSLTIPNTVTTMGSNVFANNKLTSLSIGTGITTINEASFASNKLTSLTIPSNVTAIGLQAFKTNLIKSLVIPNTVTTMSDLAFGYNSLSSLTIGTGLTSINNSVFTHNQLTSITIPNNITSIGTESFSYNNLSSVTIPSSVLTISNWTFQYNQLTSITIPSTVTTIGRGTFYKTSTSNPNLASVKNLANRSFDWGNAINGTSGYNFDIGTVVNAAGNIIVSKT